MKFTITFAGIILAALFFAGCQDEGGVQAPAVSDDPNVAALRMIEAEIQAAECDTAERVNRNFIGILSGSQEVPPTESNGRGLAAFRLAKDGGSIRYKLLVANISNVVGAHVHQGIAGENGPVVFELFSDTAGGGSAWGSIAEGTITPADLVGPYAGSTDFSMFLADLHADSLYVNVHTSDGVDSTSGAPGDYGAGEIRGQIISLPPWGDWWGDHDGDKHDKGKHKGKGHDKKRGKGHDKDGDGKDDHRYGRGGDDDDDDDDGHGG